MNLLRISVPEVIGLVVLAGPPIYSDWIVATRWGDPVWGAEVVEKTVTTTQYTGWLPAVLEVLMVWFLILIVFAFATIGPRRL